MQIQRIQPQQISVKQHYTHSQNPTIKQYSNDFNNGTTAPIGFRYNAQIHFGEFFDPNRTVPHIDYEEYMAMSDNTKKRFRKRYNNFTHDKSINKKELIDSNYPYMPLRDEQTMDKFLETSRIYLNFKDNPIICLGRSPKWFLNAALWMKDGIDDYKFVAFSKNWYMEEPFSQNLERKDVLAPTEKEEMAYRRYLKRIKADPQTIVDHMKKTGKKTIITDYIDTGKGMTSFLDIMSRYAEDLGILEEFSKSIHLVGIGSSEWVEKRRGREDFDPIRVQMPDKLKPYEKSGLFTYNITQEFHEMDYNMFQEMLINQNTNECRSTYYPHETWTIYKPDQIRTGIIKDLRTAKQLVKELKETNERSLSSFTPAMYDYRNLLNFRILDALNKRGMLKKDHHSKV